jgi:hypothetical protein
VVVEVLQIDDSKPAYNSKPVAFPNEWQKASHPRANSERSPRSEAYRTFFQQLIDELREKHRFTAARVAQPQSWYSFASGIGGVTYAACFALGNRARAEVYIDRGNADENKRLFDRLEEQRAEIEAEYGQELEWERLDDKRASRIAIYTPGSIDADEETLARMRSWMLTQLLQLRKVFGPRLRELGGKGGG